MIHFSFDSFHGKLRCPVISISLRNERFLLKKQKTPVLKTAASACNLGTILVPYFLY